MGTTPVTPLPATIRIAAAVKQLATSAAALNEATDEFSKVTAPLDEVLQKLNLGVECWVRFDSWMDPNNRSETHHEIGYAKVSGRWGVALRTVDEDGTGDPTTTQYERWLFNDGPRTMRIAGIAKIPELLEELVKKADKATRKIQAGTQSARDVIAAVQQAATEAGVLKKKAVR